MDKLSDLVKEERIATKAMVLTVENKEKGGRKSGKEAVDNQ